MVLWILSLLFSVGSVELGRWRRLKRGLRPAESGRTGSRPGLLGCERAALHMEKCVRRLSPRVVVLPGAAIASRCHGFLARIPLLDTVRGRKWRRRVVLLTVPAA